MRLPHVLFVCVENSCRSQIAEGFAAALGRDRLAAYSAGSRPSGEVNPRAIAFMKERGIDLGAHRSKGLDDLPAGVAWDVVVTMGCGDLCPQVPAKTRLEWDLPDPKAMNDDDFRRLCSRIEALVEQIV